MKEVYNIIALAKEHNRKLLAVLIDPDTPDTEQLNTIVEQVNAGSADLIFVGGSLLVKDALDSCVKNIKAISKIPVVLFPGSILQISPSADAILMLSLISGRNPELLIGSQVIAAPYIKQSGLEVLPTGYMLVDCGKTTTAGYMSGTSPIPYHKGEIAACTAMAGEMLGLKLMYMDGGSGADRHVDPKMVTAVRKQVETPIIIGGGIRNAAAAKTLCDAGADVIVIGNATEQNPSIIHEIAEAIH
jgi:putative glycerol-1-phosphate prenyltransferase